MRIMKSKSSKGMFFSTDVMAAVIIVIAVATMLLGTWAYIKARMDETAHVQDLKYKVTVLSDILVKTGGNPVGWEGLADYGAIESIGLVDVDREINEDKLNRVGYIGKDVLQEIFRIDQFNYQIILRAADGTIVKSVGESPGGRVSVQNTRVVTYRGRPAFLEVVLWGDKAVVGGVV
jgi:hypothetical protein